MHRPRKRARHLRRGKGHCLTQRCQPLHQGKHDISELYTDLVSDVCDMNRCYGSRIPADKWESHPGERNIALSTSTNAQLPHDAPFTGVRVAGQAVGGARPQQPSGQLKLTSPPGFQESGRVFQM